MFLDACYDGFLYVFWLSMKINNYIQHAHMHSLISLDQEIWDLIIAFFYMFQLNYWNRNETLMSPFIVHFYSTWLVMRHLMQPWTCSCLLYGLHYNRLNAFTHLGFYERHAFAIFSHCTSDDLKNYHIFAYAK